MDYGTAVAAAFTVVAPLIGLQTFWIARALDRVDRSLDRIDGRLDGIENTVLRDHGERITRLETGS